MATEKKMVPGKPGQRVELGDRCRDVISKMEGIAVVYQLSITGCRQFAIQTGKLGADGELAGALFFDEKRLEILNTGEIKFPGQNLVNTPNASGDNGAIPVIGKVY